MLESIIVGVLAGLGSGLVGAILGPQISHSLDRRRRAEVRLEERNRDLRRMVETLMRLARTIISSTFEVRVAGRPTWAEHGQDRLGQAWENHRAYLTRIDQLFPDFIWRPMRIRDADLRQKANDLNREQHNLGQLVLARFGMTDPSKLEEWQVQTDEKAGNVERLLMEVDERMDELGW